MNAVFERKSGVGGESIMPKGDYPLSGAQEKSGKKDR